MHANHQYNTMTYRSDVKWLLQSEYCFSNQFNNFFTPTLHYTVHVSMFCPHGVKCGTFLRTVRV